MTQEPLLTLPYPEPISGIEYAANVLAAADYPRAELPAPSDRDILDSAWHWAEDVASLQVSSCKEMREVVVRHLHLFTKGGDADYRFDDEAALRILRFCMARMRLKDGIWDERQFVPLPWQAFYLSQIFGWKNRSDNTRKYNRSFICTGKASGKNIILATVAYYLEIADKEGSPQVVVAAATGAQARNVFDSITWSIECATPDLVDDRLSILGGSMTREIIDHHSNGWIKRIAADTKGRGASGFNLNGLVIDELHEHQNREFKDILISGLGKARRQALCVMATNAGADTTGHAYEEFRYAKNVANYATNPRYFPWLCHIEGDDDPQNAQECWIKANPSYPITPTYLPDRVFEMAGSEVRRRHIMRLNFGIWDQGGATTWLSKDQWDACIVQEKPAWIKKGMPTWIGIDLSRRSDLTSIATTWWHPQDGTAHVEVSSWMPARKAREVGDELGIPFLDWGKMGHIVLSDDGTISYGQLVRHLEDIHKEWPIKRIAADAWQVSDLLEEAETLGFKVSAGEKTPKGFIQLVRHAQGYYITKTAKLAMGLSIAATEDMALNGRLTIQFNAPLRMAQQSALVVMDGKANRMFKKVIKTMRIDPLVALVMAVGNIVNANKISQKPATTLGDLNQLTKFMLEKSKVA